jgi:hypothetical protein
MNSLGMPGTFFINTGSVTGSKYRSTFIGRPVKEIIEESKTIPVGKDNFFERASAARYLGYRGTSDYFTRAGAQMDADRMEQEPMCSTRLCQMAEVLKYQVFDISV